MALSPCNNLNVKTLRTSQLAEAASLSDNDYIQISQDGGGGVYYTRKVLVSKIPSYLSTVSTGQYTGSFLGSVEGSVDLTGGGLSGSAANLSATAGADSGIYLPVLFNGTKYKIKLYDNA